MSTTNQLCHFVGFRIVEGPLPASKPLLAQPDFPLLGVRQKPADWTHRPDPAQPYFKARVLISSPPDYTMDRQCEAVGFNPAIIGKIHSGGISYCPNGDLIAISFSSCPGKSESAPNTSMVITRLRCGADEWDMPGLFYKISGINDQSGLLWNDHGTIWFFGGGRDLGDVPFRYTVSRDNGATWSELKPAVLTGHYGSFTAQPINSAFRGPDGTIYVGCDAKGATSLLFASKDNGKTWFDTGGRTFGRHTTFVPLKDGRILAMGGKNSNIERHMPMGDSSDSGKTWTNRQKSPFAALGSNQRPKIMRLESGRLFFAGDFQDIRMLTNPPAEDITNRGSYVALSEDEGATWKIKPLKLAPCHVNWTGTPSKNKPQHGFGTLGYCDAVQTPDGLIHLMTSKGQPSMHFAMNEAWILSDIEGEIGKGTLLLQGKVIWAYSNNFAQYQAHRINGRVTGMEIFFNPDGTKAWTRMHQSDDRMIWTTFWPNGTKKIESRWQGTMADGMTTNWDAAGKVTRLIQFKNGHDVSVDTLKFGDD